MKSCSHGSTESKTLVGQRLYITTGTVNTHLERIRTKYAQAGRPAPTKAALVARAIQADSSPPTSSETAEQYLCP
ncbi:helix-turn-helix transcriptional regulator [Nocardia cyriacigeorgica]|uniref:helix-turn-helix transcriptional regulator n=1 Tax=Nocardia cyriacigeorgica TaxID=135487 RepID=UPI003981216D